MRINTNLVAMNTQRNLAVNTGDMGKSVEKLSSGLRVNRAADDAAGLSISEKMRAQIRGLNMASKNAQDGISLIQSAEGALNESHAILQRMRELVVQGSNGVNDTDDVAAIQDEVDQLVAELDRIVSDTEFNGMNLLDGTTGKLFAASGLTLQVGANSSQTLDILVTTEVDSAGLGVDSIDVSDTLDIDVVNSAIKTVSSLRSELGAYQNKLEHTVKNLDCVSENLSAAESRIRDVDMAKEMMNFTKSNILAQAAQSMLAQANTQPQGVLQLLR